MKVQHPMQPLVWDGKIIRFKANKIVAHLIDHGGIDMNAIALLNFSREDQEQFAQLIGYSVSGFGDLSYARKTTVAKADALADKMTRRKR